MRLRKQRGAADDFDVSMSPLIDCVFLLLIFFLVTTMLKKTEKRIPVRLPDPALTLATKVNQQANIIGMTSSGAFVRPTHRHDAYGRALYTSIDDLPAHLQRLAAEGQSDKPLVLEVQKGTSFQQVVATLDICKIQGFSNVTQRVISDNSQSGYPQDSHENSTTQ